MTAPLKPPSPIEAALGTIALQCIGAMIKLARKRRDRHEVDHLMAMILFGNSTHTREPCPLPPNLWEMARRHLCRPTAATEAS